MPDTWYNPDTPGRVGPEWTALRNGFDDMALGPSRGFMQRFRATVTENINEIPIPSLRGIDGRWGIEVYPLGGEGPANIATALSLPSIVDAGSVGVTSYLGGAPTAAMVADASASTGWVFTQPSSGKAFIDVGFAVGPAAGRILGIACNMNATGKDGNRFDVSIFAPGVGLQEIIGEVRVGSPTPDLLSPTTSAFQVVNGGKFFDTGDLAQYSVVGPAGASRFRIELLGLPGDIVLISELRQVVAFCAETRVAQGVHYGTGFSGQPHNVPTWLRGFVSRPVALGGGFFQKVAGNEYSIIVRPLDASPPRAGYAGCPQGDIRWMTVTGASAMPLGVTDPLKAGSADVHVDELGRISGIGKLNPRRVHGFAMLETAGPSTSADTQPYTSVGYATPVATIGVCQEFTDPATGSGIYQTVSVPVRRMFDVDPVVNAKPTEQLLISIVRVSDGVVMGTGYMLPEEFLSNDRVASRPLIDKWRLCEIPLNVPTGVLVNGVEYRMQVACIATAAQWQVAFLAVTDPTPLGIPAFTAAMLNGRTFGGTVNQGGTFSNLGVVTLVPSLEALMSAMSGPAAVTGFTVELGEQYFENVAACGGPAVMPYAMLRWAPHGEVGLGGHYEVQRRDPVRDLRPHTIYRLGATSADIDGVADYETWPDLASAWRIRFVRADSSFSSWSDWIYLAIVGGPAITYTSNLRPELNFGAMDVGDGGGRPSRTYVPLDPIEFRAHHQRDMQTGFIQPEERGWAFSRNLLVADSAPNVGSISHFDALHRLARAGMRGVENAVETDVQIPYVCVRERGGGRFYCGIGLGDEDIRLSNRHTLHRVVVNATTVRPTPTPVVR